MSALGRGAYAAAFSFLIGFGMVRLPELVVVHHQHHPDSEAKVNLREAFSRERASDEKLFPRADDARLLAAIPAEFFDTVGVIGTCPACEITMVAAGNIDFDPDINVWSISTMARTIAGRSFPPGHHLADDPERTQP